MRDDAHEDPRAFLRLDTIQHPIRHDLAVEPDLDAIGIRLAKTLRRDDLAQRQPDRHRAFDTSASKRVLGRRYVYASR